MASRNPNPQPGDPPQQNPGQMNPGTDYVALNSGQDIRRDGYYFSTREGTLRYFSLGDTLPGRGDTWYYVSEDRDLSLDDAAETLRRRGFDINPDDLRAE